MKKHLSIRAKLLFGMGILVVGYIASTAIGFFSGAARERELADVDKVNVPVALRSQSALFAFEASSKAFNDAIMTGESDGLKIAASRNKEASAALDDILKLSDREDLDGLDVAAAHKQIAGMAAQREEVFSGMSGDASAREATKAKAEALNASTEKLRQQLTRMSEVSARVLNEHLSDSIAATRWQRFFNLAVAGVIILCGGVVVFFIIQRAIIRPMRSIAGGLHECSTRVENASGTIREAGRALADGASSQAASLEETSATLEEISGVARKNAEHSALAKDKVSSTRQTADSGSNDVAAMRSAMSEIQTASANIAKIVKAIDEIAFQTNILALNAAVEAARAGEAGAGFAVVADEVRSLAQRSAQAARETASLIEDSIAKSTRGAQISDKVASGLELIGQQIREVDSLVAEIAEASKEQSTGVSEVNRTILHLNDTTQANAAAAEESAATVEELAAQVVALNGFTATLNISVHGSDNQTQEPAKTAPAPVKPSAPQATAALPEKKAQPAAKTASTLKLGTKSKSSAHDDFFK